MFGCDVHGPTVEFRRDTAPAGLRIFAGDQYDGHAARPYGVVMPDGTPLTAAPRTTARGRGQFRQRRWFGSPAAALAAARRDLSLHPEKTHPHDD